MQYWMPLLSLSLSSSSFFLIVWLSPGRGWIHPEAWLSSDPAKWAGGRGQCHALEEGAQGPHSRQHQGQISPLMSGVWHVMCYRSGGIPACLCWALTSLSPGWGSMTAASTGQKSKTWLMIFYDTPNARCEVERDTEQPLAVVHTVEILGQ